ncbi:MAG: hypothetical protein ACFB6R_09625 [Alphaproteobacteria bacterium]
MERPAQTGPIALGADVDLVNGEAATPLADMPQVWIDAARDLDALGSPDPADLITLGRLFHYKMVHAQIDLFANRPDLSAARPVFAQVLAVLAEETLAFYARDFRKTAYPDFDAIERVMRETGADETRLKVVAIVRDLFAEFGHTMPASFYDVHLAPLARDDVMEVRALRLSPADKDHARAWDAILHAQKVFPIQMKIQSLSSARGLTWLHGCQCDSGLSQVTGAASAFDYDFPVWGPDRWVWTFIWNTFQEYALFDVAPVTNFFRRDA